MPPKELTWRKAIDKRKVLGVESQILTKYSLI